MVMVFSFAQLYYAAFFKTDSTKMWMLYYIWVQARRVIENFRAVWRKISTLTLWLTEREGDTADIDSDISIGEDSPTEPRMVTTLTTVITPSLITLTLSTSTQPTAQGILWYLKMAYLFLLINTDVILHAVNETPGIFVSFAVWKWWPRISSRNKSRSHYNRLRTGLVNAH